jgi:hypothetical protein
MRSWRELTYEGMRKKSANITDIDSAKTIIRPIMF